MPRLLVAYIIFASVACLGNMAFANTASVGAISAKDLRTDCDVLGGKFGEFTDPKTGAHYYWCKTRNATTKCVDNKCTVTSRIPIGGAAVATGNTRNPGVANGTTPMAGNPKVGATTGGANSKGPSAPVVGAPATATTIGIAKPVPIPGPVSNNNKRQQQ